MLRKSQLIRAYCMNIQDIIRLKASISAYSRWILCLITNYPKVSSNAIAKSEYIFNLSSSFKTPHLSRYEQLPNSSQHPQVSFLLQSNYFYKFLVFTISYNSSIALPILKISFAIFSVIFTVAGLSNMGYTVSASIFCIHSIRSMNPYLSSCSTQRGVSK